MDKFVKETLTNKYRFVTQAEYDANGGLFTDRSDRPHYIYNHYEETGATYWQTRYFVKQLVASMANGFNDFNDVDKTALAQFGLGDQNAIIGHYMSSLSVDSTTAAGMAVVAMSNSVSKLSHDAKHYIIPSPKLFQIGVKYLTWVNPDGTIDSTQANNLTAAIQSFLTEYERYAILGLEYDDERVGVMDYFDSTNDYAGGGLENYTFSPNMITAYGNETNARNAMRGELDDLFVKGNY